MELKTPYRFESGQRYKGRKGDFRPFFIYRNATGREVYPDASGSPVSGTEVEKVIFGLFLFIEK